jgi:magnesium and cobalt transporter
METKMSEPTPATGLLDRLRSRFRLRSQEHSMRESIAELVSEAAQARQPAGHLAAFDPHESALIANVLRLRGTTADDVMIPRADIVAIQRDTPLSEARAQFRREGHSRMPVYGEQLDDIVGMVHIKDVFAHDTSDADFSLQSIMRTPLMVAPQLPVLDLLLQMRQAHMHLALVVDEYGGIDGLVTIEDLVETIVGDIADEHDEPGQKMVTERPDGTYDIDGRMPIEAFEAKFGPVLTEDERDADIDTVAGLVFTLAGRVPARGEVVAPESGCEFRVLDADPRRIRRLRMRRVKEE